MTNALVQIIPEGKLTVPEFREWIDAMEVTLCGHEDAHIKGAELDDFYPLTHMFTPGLYTRQIFMPADTVCITRIHLYEHPFVVSKGRVSIYDGEKIITVEAPYHGVTKPGTKRIIYNHEDTVWTTFHVTEKSDLESIEEFAPLVCDKWEDFDRLVNKEISL
jgi:hypothetical protein